MGQYVVTGHPPSYTRDREPPCASLGDYITSLGPIAVLAVLDSGAVYVEMDETQAEVFSLTHPGLTIEAQGVAYG